MTRADSDPPSAAAAMATTNGAHQLDGTDASISAASPVAGYGSTSTSSAQPRPTSSAPVPPTGAESENDDEAPDTRPAWRQPNPLWILPFTFLLTLSLGMTLAPRPQLLINLACVAHPPLAREGGALDGGAGVDSGVGLVVTDNVWTQPNSDNDWLQPQPHSDSWPRHLSTQDRTSTLPIPVPPPPNSTDPDIPIFIDPAKCRRDVGVQKLTARVQMGLRLLGGLLAVLTTGFWASLSDSWGPSRVMALSMFGIFLNDAGFLIVASFPRLVLRPGLWVLFVGPMLDGMLGSMPALSAVLSAYIAGTAGGGGMVKYFAMVNGLLSCGGAVSPIFGSWLIRVSSDFLMPFKVALMAHVVLIAFLLFLLPDPIRRTKPEEGEDMTILGRLWAPFASLAMFVPTSGRGGWNAFIMAVIICILGQAAGLSDPKTQYAVYVFDWEPSALGAFLTLNMVGRGIVLLILVPLLNRFVKPYFMRSPATTDEATERTPLLAPPPHTEPHLSPADLSEPSDPAAFIDLPDPASPPEAPTTESLHYDHTLLLTCLAIDGAAAFALGANARGSQLLFVTFSVLSNLGAPSAAGAASLAVALGPAGMQPGQLFGALGVLEALTGGSVWPVLYTGVWVGSIGWYPPAMFLLAGLVWVAAAVMVAMIRLPRAGE